MTSFDEVIKHSRDIVEHAASIRLDYDEYMRILGEIERLNKENIMLTKMLDAATRDWSSVQRDNYRLLLENALDRL